MNRLQVFCRKFFNTYIQTTSNPFEAYDLERFIALVTYNGRFFKVIKTIISPLCQLPKAAAPEP